MQKNNKRNKHRKPKSSGKPKKVTNRAAGKHPKKDTGGISLLFSAENAEAFNKNFLPTNQEPAPEPTSDTKPKRRTRKDAVTLSGSNEPVVIVLPDDGKKKRKAATAKVIPVPPPPAQPSDEMIADTECVRPVVVDDDLRNKKQYIKNFQPMYRAPFGFEGSRYYFREGFGDFYAGYSLWTKSVLPTSPHLIKWKVDNGEQGEIISLTTREYGHLFHLFIARHESLDDPFRFNFNGPKSNEWREHIWAVIQHHGLPRMYGEQWERQLKNDYLAYINWKKQYQVNVLAVETPLWDDDFRIATPADMVVSCLVKKTPYAKEPTEPAIVGVDFKTGDSGVGYDEYMLQLEFIRYAWNKRFAGTKYEMTDIYNWHPKKRSQSIGGFNFVNQSGKFTQPQFIHLAQTCAVMEYNKPTGGMMKYIDGENEFDAAAEKVNPYDFLKAFFVKK